MMVGHVAVQAADHRLAGDHRETAFRHDQGRRKGAGRHALAAAAVAGRLQPGLLGEPEAHAAAAAAAFNRQFGHRHRLCPLHPAR
jgi:hypothetical protein